MTVKRIISGEVLKYRNGLRISGDYETRSTGASYFALTVPLAVTKEQDGKETHSINARENIGNPCYLTKQSCDAAMKVYKAGQQ